MTPSSSGTTSSEKDCNEEELPDGRVRGKQNRPQQATVQVNRGKAENGFPPFCSFRQEHAGSASQFSSQSEGFPSTALSHDKVLGHVRGRCNFLESGSGVRCRATGQSNHRCVPTWWKLQTRRLELVVGQSGGTGIRVPPARRSVGVFRCQPSAAITEPAGVRININIRPAVSAGSGKHEGAMIGG